MKIVVDLSAAAEEYTGIGQDIRQIFSMLTSHRNFSVSGLMYPLGRPAIPRTSPWARDADARIAGTINAISYGWYRRPAGRMLHRLYVRHQEVRQALRTQHEVLRVPNWLKTDALWRIMFQKTIAANERQRILENEFFVTDLSLGQMVDRAITLPYLSDKKLKIGNCDAMLFPLPRPITVRASVMKVVRYHDAIPFTAADTVTQYLDICIHRRFTTACATKSVFVCNSPMSLSDLDNVAPGTGEHAAVIPCAIQSPDPPKYDPHVKDILTKRLSLRALASDEASSTGLPVRQIIERSLRQSENLRYIISVSSLEPRKNFVSAIAAWERLRAITGKDVKFVMVANDGWKMEATLEVMRQHVMSGNLLHVRRLPMIELQALYKHAEFCIFPSYAEGFGYAPLEALAMGTPSVVSDIPVFRWNLADAALFADPYSVADLTEASMRLLREPANHATRTELLANSRVILERFSAASISEQWRAFFEDDVHRLHEIRIKSAKRRQAHARKNLVERQS